MAITFLQLVNQCLQAVDQPKISDTSDALNPDEFFLIRDAIQEGISVITSAYPSYVNWVNTTTVTANAQNQINLSAITDPARIISLSDATGNPVQYSSVSATVIEVPGNVGTLTLKYSGRPAMPVNNNDTLSGWSDDMVIALKFYVLYSIKTFYGHPDAMDKYQLFTTHLKNLTANRQSYKMTPRKQNKLIKG